MSRPIPGNFVRPRQDIQVPVLPGTTGLPSRRKSFALKREMHGLVDEKEASKPDCHIVLFELGGTGVLRTEMHHADLKGVEL